MSTSLVPTDQVGIDRQIALHIGQLRVDGWLVYAGIGGLDLLRKLCIVRGLDKPKLWVQCERGAGYRVEVYEDFVPLAVAIDGFHGTIEVRGSIRSGGKPQRLLFDRTKLADRSGEYISYVTTQPHHRLRLLETMYVRPIA